MPKFGSCMTGHHDTCPAVREPQAHLDPAAPARRPAKYLTRRLVCYCPCHARPFTINERSQTIQFHHTK